MPDLNPESLRRAEAAYHEAAGASVVWDNWTAPPTLRARLSYNPSAGVEAAIRTYLSTTPNPLRDAVGDLLHMHRQGEVSAEMWGRLEAVFDGGGV